VIAELPNAGTAATAQRKQNASAARTPHRCDDAGIPASYFGPIRSSL
jgi:hypothetical protein